MQIPIVRSDSLNQVLAERARLLAREGPRELPTLGGDVPYAGSALGTQHWQGRHQSDFLYRLHQATAYAPSSASDEKGLPLWHLLWAVPCLLAVAVLIVALLAPQSGMTQPSHDVAASAVALPPQVNPSKGEESAGAPTCPSCHQPMGARRNRETGELLFVCKTPNCEHAAPSTGSSRRHDRD
jgi:hypothetical protein